MGTGEPRSSAARDRAAESDGFQRYQDCPLLVRLSKILLHPSATGAVACRLGDV